MCVRKHGCAYMCEHTHVQHVDIGICVRIMYECIYVRMHGCAHTHVQHVDIGR